MSRSPRSVGDYVIASDCREPNPNEPWYVSNVTEIGISKSGIVYKVAGCDRWLRFAYRISKEEGERILRTWPVLEKYAEIFENIKMKG